jgi:PAS domain S-box-containing protein
MQAGASDYLVKGEISADLLERSIRYALDEARHLRIIEENEKKYFGVFEKAHDLIILADCNKNVIDANPAAIRSLQYSKEEMLELNLKHLFFQEEQCKHFFEHICGVESSVRTEYNFVTKHGKKLDVMVSAVTLDEQEQIFLCVVQDITERKREELEKQQQQKFVVTGRIARVIAHEVRNPLTNILLAVSQFKGEPVSVEDSQVYVDIIERNCTRINQLITELLHSTRMMELNIRPHGINELTDKALALAQDRLQLNGINVKKEYLKQDVMIPADEEKVIIALLNIIINAVEAMTPGAGLLTLQTAKQRDKGVITIIDNGPGIPEETRTRLFDPFFTNKPKGTGLGLTSTQNIIMNHKGTVHVESEIGEGTVFTVVLPLN